MKPLNITMTSDFICPWCWIGEAHLESALASLAASDDAKIRFVPYQLNPDMPPEGTDRKAYRTAKFGSWARSQTMDAQVAHAGLAAGLKFDYSIIDKTPNTLAAHRLVWREQSAGRDARPLVRAIFSAYFAEGRDIGDANVLADIAQQFAQEHKETLGFLASNEGVEEVLQLASEARDAGVQSVPNFAMDGHTLSGAQPADVFIQVLQRHNAA